MQDSSKSLMDLQDLRKQTRVYYKRVGIDRGGSSKAFPFIANFKEKLELHRRLKDLMSKTENPTPYRMMSTNS